MKLTYTVPQVPGSKRTSERPYTHAIIGRRDGRCTARGIEATMAVDEPKSRRWDAKHWDDCQRGSVAVAGQLYRNHNGVMVEAREAIIAIDAGFMAENPDRAAYIEKMASERAAYLAKLKASQPGPLCVLQWSMSMKNAYNAVGSKASHHSDVRVVECVPVEKKAKAAKRAGAENKFFREIAIGQDFWMDGKFWRKTDDTHAESETTTRTIESDDVVMA